MDMTQIPNYEDMIKSGMHFGRKKSIFHPNMKPFVFTVKEHIYILDLTKTTEAITKATEFLAKALGEGKLVLFVGITEQSADAIKETAEALNMPYVTERWLGGTLTNFKVITSRVKYLEDLEKQKASGELEKFTKKEKLLKEREIVSLQKKYNGLRKLSRVPDIIFISSLKESMLSIREAKTTGVKTVGIVNTDSDPKLLDIAIPANDNSRKSIELIMKVIRDGVAERLSHAKEISESVEQLN